MLKEKDVRRGDSIVKILIVGTVGTGKTTLAKKLSKEMNINYFEIDSIVHNDQKAGKKRTPEEQEELIKKINQNDNWILEGVLRKNLYFLLEMADKIIYLNISKSKRNRRILIRFLKQKLKIEKANYTPSFRMLKQMFKWSNDFEKNKNDFEELIKEYKEKVEIITA